MRLFLLIQLLFFINCCFAQNEEKRIQTNVDFSSGSNISFESNLFSEQADVKIQNRPGFEFGIGVMFQYENKFLLYLQSEARNLNYFLHFNYLDRNGELGYNISDKIEFDNFYWNLNLLIGEKFKILKRGNLSIGGGISCEFQKGRYFSSLTTAQSTSNNIISIFYLDAISNKFSAFISPKFFIESVIYSFKDNKSQLILNVSYNYSKTSSINGNYYLNDGNSNYSIGDFKMTHHYLSCGIKWRIIDI